MAPTVQLLPDDADVTHHRSLHRRVKRSQVLAGAVHCRSADNGKDGAGQHKTQSQALHANEQAMCRLAVSSNEHL